MSLGLLATPTVTICKVAKMVFNVAPGNFYLSQYLEYQEANGTSATVEALAGLAGGTDAAFVTTVLTNLGLADDAGAEAFLTSAVAASGRGAALEAAIAALDGVAADDATYGAAKTAFDSVVTTSVVYSTNTANNSTDVAVLAASINAEAIQAASTSGLSITLTSSADTSPGSAGNDTYVAVVDGTTAANTTLSSSDELAAGDGTDTLKITMQGAATANAPTPSATGFEAVEVRNVSAGATILAAGTFNGATDFKNDRSTQAVEFTNIGTANLTIVGNGSATNGDTDFTSSGTGSVTDALTINVQGGVTAGDISNDTTADGGDTNGDWSAVTVNVTGGTDTSSATANTVGAMALSGGSKLQTLTINATTGLTTGAITGWDTTGTGVANKGAIVVTGAALVDLDGATLNAAVESVNASGSTGGVRVDASSQTDFQFVGSTGDDRFQAGAVLSSSGSVDAGEGTDRLIIDTSGHITSTVGAYYSNFEVLEVGNGVTVDLDHLATNNTIEAIRLNGATTGATDLNATQAGAVTILANTTATVTPKNSTDLGQIDTVKLIIDDGASATATIALTAPVLSGVEKLEIDASADNVTISALTSATAVDTITITGGKTVGITTGAAMGNTNQLIDGSAATGALTINAAAATGAIRILGGTGDDVITTGANADTVYAGDGLDAVTVTATGVTTLKLDATTSANADVVIDLLQGTDKVDYNGALANGTGSSNSGIAAAEIASATTFAGALATAGAADDILFLATTAIAAGAGKTAADALTAAGTSPTDALVTAVETEFLGTGGALNGAIANLDTVLGAGDSVLAAFTIATTLETVLFRITNTDTATANTLTSEEVELVGYFDSAATLVAGDFV